jgi:hypothetical protein
VSSSKLWTIAKTRNSNPLKRSGERVPRKTRAKQISDRSLSQNHQSSGSRRSIAIYYMGCPRRKSKACTRSCPAATHSKVATFKSASSKTSTTSSDSSTPARPGRAGWERAQMPKVTICSKAQAKSAISNCSPSDARRRKFSNLGLSPSLLKEIKNTSRQGYQVSM